MSKRSNTEIAVAVAKGSRTFSWGWESVAEAAMARIIAPSCEHPSFLDPSDWTVADAGLALVAEAEASRKRRNANSRARDAAYRACGMRRTAYGWE